MLSNPTVEKLKSLKLFGMLRSLEEQMSLSDLSELDFFDRLGLMVDREIDERQNRKLRTRLKTARLRQSASLENLDYRHPRGIDKAMIASLASCRWISVKRNILITGPTGVGKTYMACALVQKALREGFSGLYKRVPRLVHELGVARADGSYHRLMNVLAKTDVLILDDWGLAPLNAEQSRDLLEVVDDRYGIRSTLIAAQLPVESWHEFIGDPTVADAILDRLVHNAYRISLRGESMRKLRENTDEL